MSLFPCLGKFRHNGRTVTVESKLNKTKTWEATVKKKPEDPDECKEDE